MNWISTLADAGPTGGVAVVFLAVLLFILIAIVVGVVLIIRRIRR
jgi:Na+-transporting methylmalonyl-CoA/oxaloacetate decarboxylase gamma subunit